MFKFLRRIVCVDESTYVFGRWCRVYLKNMSEKIPFNSRKVFSLLVIGLA